MNLSSAATGPGEFPYRAVAKLCRADAALLGRMQRVPRRWKGPGRRPNASHPTLWRHGARICVEGCLLSRLQEVQRLLDPETKNPG